METESETLNMTLAIPAGVTARPPQPEPGSSAEEEARSSLDTSRLAEELRTLRARSLALKGRLRQRWTEPMGDVQRELLAVQLETTERLVLLTWTRGRLHVRTMPQRDAVQGTDTFYFRCPGTRALQLIRWDPSDYRDRIVRALRPVYAAAPSHAGRGAASAQGSR